MDRPLAMTLCAQRVLLNCKRNDGGNGDVETQSSKAQMKEALCFCACAWRRLRMLFIMMMTFPRPPGDLGPLEAVGLQAFQQLHGGIRSRFPRVSRDEIRGTHCEINRDARNSLLLATANTCYPFRVSTWVASPPLKRSINPGDRCRRTC